MLSEIDVQRAVERVVESKDEEKWFMARELFRVDERVVAILFGNLVWVCPGDLGRDSLPLLASPNVPVEIRDLRATSVGRQ